MSNNIEHNRFNGFPLSRPMTIQSLDRALNILSLFSTARPWLGVTEIGKALGLSKTTVHNLAKTLKKHGYLQQDPATRKYGLGLRLHELGSTLAGSLPINRFGIAPARTLARKTGLTARLALWDRGSALVTLNIFPGSNAPFMPQLGPRVPAYCSSLGKAILAFLSEEDLDRYLKETQMRAYTPNTITEQKDLLSDLRICRERGWAMDREEYLQGMVCAGAPVLGTEGEPLGAVSMSGGPEKMKTALKRGAAQELAACALEISLQLGYEPGCREMNAAATASAGL